MSFSIYSGTESTVVECKVSKKKKKVATWKADFSNINWNQ